MNNFEFQNPVKIIFGKGEIAKVANEIPSGHKVMVTYGGGSIKRNGVYDQVITALKGFDIVEFGGIEPNPRYETLMKAVEVVKNENVDFLLAVGGGSVIDGTKFISAAVYFEGDPWDMLSRGAKVLKAMPLGVVLTLPATGSEMNGGAVITKEATQEKYPFGSPLMMPRFSVLDPDVMRSLPERQIQNGIIDAFVHVTEQYLTYPVDSPIQDRFAEGILLTLIEEGPKFLADKNNYNAGANFTWAATMALNGLIGAGVPSDWATHMIGHELTALHEIDHARTLAIVLPAVMKHQQESKKEKILQYGERIWGITSGNDEERIDAAIRKTEAFFNRLEVATRLSDYGVPESTIEKIKDRFEKRPYKLGENSSIGAEQVEEILQLRL